MRYSFDNQAICLSYILASVASVQAQQGQGQGDVSPYVPVYTGCPSDLRVRPASDGLSESEQRWRDTRGKQLIPALQSYLKLAAIDGLDISHFTDRLNSSNYPVIGLSVSGGGTQSGIGGLGIWQAFDARHSAARAARTGGLTQLLSYITGLSGGGAVTVSTIAANNFTTVESIRKAVNFSIDYSLGPSGNETQYLDGIFENAGAKVEAGFPVNVADTFGQFWGTYLPEGWSYSNYSDIARPSGALASGDAPLPIIALAEVVPGVSPEIGGLMFPGRNSTNGFNLTAYEVTPFEFGSWAGGRVQAFMPTNWLGTPMINGTAQNDSECVLGFDKFTFIQGSTTNAFTAWFIDDFYGIPTFAKRKIQPRQQSNDTDDIPIPSEQENNPLVEIANQTASNFDQTLNESLWATYPNPFQNYNEEMQNVQDLLLVDGSLTGETNPIRPLIIPYRKVDLIIVYEASSDSQNSWVNGTNLINSAQSASQGNIPFPEIPDVQTMVNLNLTRQPTFFGCNDTGEVPLVLYLPNSPWSSYSNYSYTQSSFTDTQLDATLYNAFQLATYGNSTVDENWPVCLACAVIKGSASRVEVDLPKQCTACFNRHCWNGRTSDAEVTAENFDFPLRLNTSVTYEQWNQTVWSSQQASQDQDGSSVAVRRVPNSVFGMAVAALVLSLI